MEKENEMEDIRLTPEESWPAMEQQLDRYYALKRRKRIAWYLMSVALLGTIVGYWYFKSPSVPASMVGSIDMIPLRETAAVNPIAVRPPASNTLQSALPGQKESTAAVFADQPESSNERANHRDASVGTGRSRQSEWSSPSPESQVDRSTGEQTMLRTDAAVSSTGTASSEADNKISDVASGNTAAARSAAESPASEGPAIVESALIVDAPVGKRTIEPMSEAGTAEVHPVVDFAASPSSPGDSSMVKSVETQALAPWSVAATPQIRKDTARRSSGSGSSGSLEIAYGRYIRSRTLSSDDAAWDQRRMDEEEIRIPQSFTVLYSRQVGKWSMGAGFEFWKLGESTYYTGSVAYDSILDNSYYTYQVDSLDTLYLSGNQLILRDASPDVLDSVYNLQFDTVNGTAVDPSLVTRNGIVSWSLVQVPVRFGYTVGSGKLSLAGQVSVAPGILTGFRGQYLDASQSRLVSAGELAPVRRFQLAANVGFRLEYRFGGAWSVLAGPDWRRQFTSMYRKESAIDQRYSPWGISAGVKCRLGGN